MLIESSSGNIRILAPAKVNLFLEVLGKRPDGFHEIETVLCPIALFDRLTLEPTEKPQIELQVVLPSEAGSNQVLSGASTGDPAWQIPSDSANLVWRAVAEVQKRLGVRHGCRIRLEKTIPAAAGLGGGSSDAAAAVCAGMLAWDQWNRPLATEICAALGSDIPFFLGDEQGFGLAAASGRGEKCTQIGACPNLDFVLTHPPVGCSTADVYRAFAPLARTRQFQEIIKACENGQIPKIGAELFNALQSPAARLTDWIERQLRLFTDCGVEHSLMSGSGSSCFALVGDQSITDHIKDRASAIGLKRVYTAKAWHGASIEQQVAPS